MNFLNLDFESSELRSKMRIQDLWSFYSNKKHLESEHCIDHTTFYHSLMMAIVLENDPSSETGPQGEAVLDQQFEDECYCEHTSIGPFKISTRGI
ncbi:hypothetical protein JCM33374_g4348 [Metschnikowia sp. JCM 33374]|nr:hypothetical protein JCM33374_g4348 [Metschnikowia sp. JCM 33374]